METAAKGAKKGSLVTLSDGRQVDSWSEEYRLYCEASGSLKSLGLRTLGRNILQPSMRPEAALDMTKFMRR